MAEEAIVINEPSELSREFEEGTILNVEGKVLKVKNDTRNESGCNVCAFCAECHFIEITL